MTTVLQVATSQVAACSLSGNSSAFCSGSATGSRPVVPLQSGLRLSFRQHTSSSKNPSFSSRSSISRISCEKKEAVAGEKTKEKTGGGAGVVTDATFKELVLESTVPVLIDFWAPWCGPCRMIAPLIDDISVMYAGKLRCLKMNTDESAGIPTELGIRSIPTVMIFKDGKKLDTVIGAVPLSTLTTTIDKYLN